jgi:hypothetical protein
LLLALVEQKTLMELIQVFIIHQLLSGLLVVAQVA